MNRFALLFPAVLLLAGAGVQAQTATDTTAAGTPEGQASPPVVAQPVPGDNRQGTVKTVHGNVTLVRGQTRRAAVEGGAVRQGDLIVAGADSSAAVMLRDGTVVSVGPNSTAELSQYRFEPTTEDGGIALSLLKGSLRVVTGLITRATASENESAKVKVTTPTAVIGVRGTDVVVDTDS
ncbi:MAG: FecR domain-containing protein [Burkholderiaceae bacterium]|jgi:hypothetical protein|nr:FecR domain-containing protein [Burkholderiaceae bacterium]